MKENSSISTPFGLLHEVLSERLSDKEIDQLLKDGLDIFNIYSSLYNASMQSSGIIGRDDYNHLLKFIGLGLKKWDEDIEKQYKEIGVQIKKVEKV